LPIAAHIRVVVVDDSTGYPGAPESIVGKKEAREREQQNGTIGRSPS